RRQFAVVTVPHLQKTEPIKRLDCEGGVRRLLSDIERYRLRPNPAEAGEQAVIGVAHYLRQPLGLDSAEPGDGEVLHIDRYVQLDTLDQIPTAAIGLYPKRPRGIAI